MQSGVLQSLAGEVGERLLAITFDDGPSEWTLRIADAFAARGGRATFFVIGEAIPDRVDVLRELDAGGHEIGNHTMTHQSLVGLTRQALVREIGDTNRSIEDTIGRRPTLLRPPFVTWDDGVLEVAGELGQPWTVCAPAEIPDWQLAYPGALADLVLAEVQPGAIISLHDGRPPREPEEMSLPTREHTAEAVDIVLAALVDSYRFVTVSELIAAAGRPCER